MNLSEHVHVTWALHVEMSVAGCPELTRVIGVPRDAPSYWLIEAYRLSLGLEPEAPELESDADRSPLIDLCVWRTPTQQVPVPGVADVVDVAISGPYATRMGDPRVTVIEPGSDPVTAHPSTEWQTQRPAFRAEHVGIELAQRFGLVQPRLDPAAWGVAGDALRPFSPLAALCDGLSPARRLALLAHLDDARLIDAVPFDETAAGSEIAEMATAGIRTLVTRVDPDGVDQDPAAGWLPRAIVSDAVDALDWPAVAVPGLPDPVDALASLARRTKAIRRLRGCIVVTHLGRALADGEVRAFLRIIDGVRALGRERLFPSGWPRAVTLALLAVADGSASTFDELFAVVARGEAAVEEGRGDGRFSEWSPRAHLGGSVWRAGDPAGVHRVIESLCALSSPGEYGSISPAMRAVARAALQ
ncbi:hypothetical protein RN51_00358 [Microbacterium oxydans]|uniref:Uncharacterized protein n=1 Tax=Microbacterium oxydans TaxID=82380 RepID=A0A0F0KZ28_9MICO|nr:hypothetical protein [Microbacterium oxydans]KJL26138.1 hypothetical protein RN51_00358 [Microbacterium oxydans]